MRFKSIKLKPTEKLEAALQEFKLHGVEFDQKLKVTNDGLKRLEKHFKKEKRR